MENEELEITEEELEMIRKNREHGQLAELPYPKGDPRNPNPAVAVGARLRSAAQLRADFEDGVKTKGARFIARISTPKKDPIAEGASDKAESKYASKMTEVIDQGRRQKKLAKMSFADWGDEVAKLTAADWVGPTTRKADKWGKRWAELEGIRLYVLTKLDAMSIETAADRTAKMTANLECMRIVGQFSKGVITEAAARTAIDAAAR